MGQLTTVFGAEAAAAKAAEAAETLARQGRIAERLAAQEGRQIPFDALKEAAAEARNAGLRFEQEAEQGLKQILADQRGTGNRGFKQ